MEIYLDLREKIEDRIEEIGDYYELNFDKPNAQYFEKGRMKLKKLLMFEPSSVSEMRIEGNNHKNYALVINSSNKNTIEDYNNINNINIQINENNENILNKSIKQNIPKKKKGKIKFIPLKEKKWKKTKSMEDIKPNKNINENIYKNKINIKKNFDNQNNHIYINKQSNLYINKNYNLYGEYKKNNVLNKFIKQNPNYMKGKSKSLIEQNFRIYESDNSSRSQEKTFNSKEYM